MSTAARFFQLWSALGATGDPAPVAVDLITRWSEPQRHYHTLAHLDACLALLDAHRELATTPTEVEMALWFHDAIYDLRASDNESRSAALATETLASAGVLSARIERIAALILVTRTHQALPGDADAPLLLDIDLAILGAEPDTYHAYSAAIRREYAWVQEADYRAKRAEVLERFLARPRLFLTAPFFAARETAARANLAAEIAGLRK